MNVMTCSRAPFKSSALLLSHRQQDPTQPFVHKNQLLSLEFLEQWNGTLIQEVRHVRHLKTLLGQNYQERKEDTTPMHSPTMPEMSFSSMWMKVFFLCNRT